MVTARDLVSAVSRELPEVNRSRIIGEPVARNTAPAIAIAAALVLRECRDAVMGVFPADHHIQYEDAYRALVALALDATGGGDLIVLGIPPTRPETGYGYVEFAARPASGSAKPARVARFLEKPTLDKAREFLASGRYFWNSGQFFWRAASILDEIQRWLPGTWETVRGIAGGSAKSFQERMAKEYGHCRSVSIDRGVLERSTQTAGFPAPEIGWSDLGSWEALHELLPKDSAGNCMRSPALAVRSNGNYVDVPGRRTVLLGVSGLVVVETRDALLVCRREDSQDLGDVTDALGKASHRELL